MRGRPVAAKLLDFTFFAVFVLLSYATLSGCAINYVDKKTGIEHIWGFGHMEMHRMQSQDGVQAVVRGTDVFGVSVGKAYDQVYFTLGAQRNQQVEIIQPDTAFRLQYPEGALDQATVSRWSPSQLSVTPLEQSAGAVIKQEN